MKTFKTLFVTLCLALLSVSCNKDHYDVSNVQGINAEGEVLLPLAFKSFTVTDLLERLEIQDEMEWSESGDITFCFDYEQNGVVKGADLLKFKDIDFEEHYTFENNYQDEEPPFTDTMVSVERSILFDSEHIHVMRAQMKSGRFDFMVASNLGEVQRVVLRSDNIKDEAGNDFELDLPVQNNTFSFDMGGLRYVSDTANTLNLRCDFYVHAQHTTDPELFVDLNIQGREMAFSQMQGFIDRFESRSSLDSVFTLFSDNWGGILEVKGARIKVSERNTFGLGASLVVDTALIYSEGLPPYSVIEPLPLSVALPAQTEFREVFDREVNGQINAMGGRAYATTNFVVNPEGIHEMVTVNDTTSIDTRIDVEIPFSFNVDHISYCDTLDVNFDDLEKLDMMEQLVLEMSFTSTLPFNLGGDFLLYNDESESIVDSLSFSPGMIKASFDGEPVKTDLTFVIDEDKMDRVTRFNHISMNYYLDSDAHDVKLNANQKLEVFLKARAKYKTNVVLDEWD